MAAIDKAQLTFIAVLLLTTACASTSTSSQSGASPPPASDLTKAAPWKAGALPASAVPAVFSDVWTRAQNRARCALLALSSLPANAERASPRSAYFSGGWGVAYDLPDVHSAFGVAGSGSSATAPDIYNEWPHKIEWPDGSSAAYGLEGHTGPNWLAYVKIPGQQCLYNVWSRRGKADLEQLIASLRFVTPKP